MEESPIRIGISSCLLGQEVRFDAGHKRDRYVTDTLAEYFEWVPVCPEVELGLGIPRETIHFIQIGGDVRLRAAKSEVDLTQRMWTYAKKRVVRLADDDLDGYKYLRDQVYLNPHPKELRLRNHV